MSILANRLNLIKPSATLAVSNRAKELQREGRKIIDLGTGEPDFDTPDFIKEGAIQAMRNGATKYTPVDGTVALKEAIVQKLKRENGLTYQTSNIGVASGAKHSIYNAFMATLNPGDEVIIPAPYWVSYPEIVRLAEGVPVLVTCPQSSGFKITPEQLEKAITPKTKWLLLNSPSNPTGATYTKAELEGLVAVLQKYPHVWIMSDDIYEHILYDGHSFTNVFQIDPTLCERGLIINGVAKAYSMTGWRIGYAAGPEAIIKAMAKLQSQSTSNPCSISQAATVTALNGNSDFLNDWRAVFQERRDFVCKALNAITGIECTVPEGAFYLYPSCAGIIGRKTPDGKTITSDQDMATYLLETGGVAVVPGIAFGLSPHFRLSIATSTEKLKEACTLMVEALKKLR